MIKQNPFSVYDFLGYLIPGSISLYAYLIINYLNKYNDHSIQGFINCIGDYKFEGIFFFSILSYILGHLLSFISSITIEKYANWKYSYPSKYLLKFEHKGYWKSATKLNNYFWRIAILIILFPCILLDFILGKLLNFKSFYTKELDPMLKSLVILKINKLFEKIGFGEIEDYKEFDDGNGNSHDFHRVVTHYAYEYSVNHQTKMSNYVALYGFLRTLCLIFNFIAFYFIIKVSLNLDFTLWNLYFILILSGISYISFMAFMKFYRRYTLEGFMIITIDKEL